MANINILGKLKSFLNIQGAEKIQVAEKVQGADTININIIGDSAVDNIIDRLATTKLLPAIEKSIRLETNKQIQDLMNAGKLIGLDVSLETQQDIALLSAGATFHKMTTTSSTTSSTTTELPEDEDEEG